MTPRFFVILAQFTWDIDFAMTTPYDADSGNVLQALIAEAVADPDVFGLC